jgi:IS5 family transposase
MNRARKEPRRLKTITGRVFRKLERWSNRSRKQKEKVYTLLEKVRRVLLQKREDKNKIYSLHEPDVECISKGKSASKI